MEVVRSLYQGQLTITLRYFFSAAFQGVAALVGLWAIFGFYVMETLERRKRETDYFVERNVNWGNVRATLAQRGWQDLAKMLSQREGRQKQLFDLAVRRYRWIDERKADLLSRFRLVLLLGVVVMTASSVGLLTCGASESLDRWFFLVAVATLIATLALLWLIAKNSLDLLAALKFELRRDDLQN